ncbi:MAG: NAD(P)-dependent oxidoreductase, partial [Paracoccaceae bacterium]
MTGNKAFPQSILITGAAGNLGQVTARALSDRLRAGHIRHLRLADIRPIPAAEGVEAIQTPISSREVAFDLAEGMDAIIHLSGIPTESTWEALIPANITATAHLWDAAVAHGVDRVLFASSNHAVGMYPVGRTVDHSAPPCPDSRYGLTKAFPYSATIWLRR